jgi:hypothetical protein
MPKRKAAKVATEEKEEISSDEEPNSPDSQENENQEQKKDDKDLSAAAFLRLGKNLKVVVEDQEYILKPKENSTGTFGWSVGGASQEIQLGDAKYDLILTMNFTVKPKKK